MIAQTQTYTEEEIDNFLRALVREKFLCACLGVAVGTGCVSISCPPLLVTLPENIALGRLPGPQCPGLGHLEGST